MRAFLGLAKSSVGSCYKAQSLECRYTEQARRMDHFFHEGLVLYVSAL